VQNAIRGYSGYKPLTPEAVIAAHPDFVLMTDQGMRAAGGVNGVLRLPGIAHTSAGKNRRVMSLEAMFLLGYGPRMPAALTALSTAIEESFQ